MKYFRVNCKKIVKYTKEFFIQAEDEKGAKILAHKEQENAPTSEWDLAESKFTPVDIELLGDESEFKDSDKE